MRIGIFSDTYTPDINGVAISVHTLKTSLEEAGHEVFVITTKHGLIGIEYENNVLRLPGLELKKLYGYVFTTPLQLRAFMHVKEMHLDIIHVHTEFGVGMFAHACGKMLKLPIVLTYHTTYEDYTHYINKYNIKMIDRFAKSSVVKISRILASSSRLLIAPSQKTKDMLLRYGITREIKVIPTGLDLDKFNPEFRDEAKIKAFRDRLSMKDHEKLLVYVGRIAKEKSIDEIIEAFRLLRQNRDDIKLVIVGSGPSEEDLKALVKSYELEELITFFGKVDNEDVPRAYQMGDVFISASTTETQGLTYIEALASGLVVFARSDEAIKDLIKDGENGYLFESVETLAKQLDDYFNFDEARKTTMRNKALESVLFYSKANFAKNVIAAYELAIEIYTSAYTIVKMDNRNGFVSLKLQSRYDQIELDLLEETCEEKRLVETKMITKDELHDLFEDELLVKAYRKCINKLARRDLSHKEIHDILMNESYLSIEQLGSLMEILERQGLINDHQLIQMTLSSMQEKRYGRNRIIAKLRLRGIAEELIEQYYLFEDYEDENKLALEYAQEIQGSIDEVSLMAKKDRLKKRLIYRGFDFEVADRAIRELDFEADMEKEWDNCIRETLRTHRQIQRRNLKNEDTKRRRLSLSLAKKGFKMDMIQAVIRELESEGRLNDK